MSKEKYLSEPKDESGLSIKIDVTRIVKYVCVTGIVIVAIIFGTRLVKEFIKKIEF